jgi:taurine dioxygenase
MSHDIEIVPLDAPLGAEVRGLDLAAGPTPLQLDAVRRAWARHLVLVVRGQTMDDHQLVAFSRAFGRLDMPNPHYHGDPFHADVPELNIISNIVEAGRAIGKLGSAEAAWHADMTYNDMPPKAAILHAIEVPPMGGDTCFADMYAAYESLDADLRRRIEGRRAVHDAAHNSAGERRQGYAAVTDARLTPGARHPMVRTDPVTGRKGLFLGRRPNSYVVGMEIAESEELLDAAWAAATRDELTMRHRWRAGDVVMWDNLAVLHRRDAFDAGARRRMHRSQISGDAPIL